MDADEVRDEKSTIHSLLPSLQCTSCPLRNCNGERHKTSLKFLYPVCSECGIELNELLDLYNEPTLRNPLTCEICDKIYTPADDVNQHFVEHFQKGVTWWGQCVSCNSMLQQTVCSTARIVKSEEDPLAHYDILAQCEPETVKTVNNGAMSSCVEIERPLNADGLYECQHCPSSKRKTFKTLQYFLRHEQDAHQIANEDDQPVACPKCPRRFKSVNQLQLHSRIHTASTTDNDDEKKCRMCGLSFTNFFDKSQHEKQSHCNAVTGRWSCPKCTKDFASHMGLILHLRLHEDNRPFMCDQCAASFRRKSHLERHLTSHSAVRPFECDSCPNKTFTSMYTLYMHIYYQHKNSTKYPCDKCDRVFTYATDRKRHIRTHGGVEKKLVCLACDRRFYEQKELRQHIQKQHKL